MLKYLLIFFLNALFANAPILVGIAGGTGSGKTTLATRIHKAFPNSILISQDSYYRDLSHLPFEERAKTNFDHPDALEFELLQKHLILLKEGQSVEMPIYSFHIHSREKGTERILPSDIVIVEGILLFAMREIRDLFDIKIFVDTDDDVRILRRIERDMLERSRTFQSVKTRYLEMVKPMHEAFVEPSKKFADIIVPEGGHNEVAIDLILSKLESAL